MARTVAAFACAALLPASRRSLSGAPVQTLCRRRSSHPSASRRSSPRSPFAPRAMAAAAAAAAAAQELTPLYPAVDVHAYGMLPVSDGHEIYWEEAGNPSGAPILFVHGGPGGGIEPKCRQFFDPAFYRVVLFTQRGCGQSTPRGCLTANTTQHLVADMEALRAARGIDNWALFGGSWGSTLSLAYAQTHPERVTALVLRGIFAVRRAEVDWLYERQGAAMLAPVEFGDYVRGLPERLRDAPRLLDAFDEVFSGGDEGEKDAAAVAWSSWEGATSYFHKQPGPLKYSDPGFAAVFARIECHYFKNGGFFPRDGHLLEKENLDKVRHIPTTIVQGRWDIVCPLRTAQDLARALPEASFTVVEGAGHSAFEPGTASELVRATDRLRSSL